VPDLLCRGSARLHVGTTDVDVQVDLEIQGGSVNGTHLEAALGRARFKPDDSQRGWRWKDESGPGMVVKIEFLADQDDIPDETTVLFHQCESLGAVNLRGTGFAARDYELRTIAADIDGTSVSVELRVATLPAYLLASSTTNAWLRLSVRLTLPVQGTGCPR
jgi:hypothetical protein